MLFYERLDDQGEKQRIRKSMGEEIFSRDEFKELREKARSIDEELGKINEAEEELDPEIQE